MMLRSKKVLSVLLTMALLISLFSGLLISRALTTDLDITAFDGPVSVATGGYTQNITYTVAFKINAATGAGTTLRFELERNTAYNCFQGMPTVEHVIPFLGQAVITDTPEKLIIEIPLTGGGQDDQGNVKFIIPFDTTLYGWAAPDTLAASATIYAVQTDATEISKNVTTRTTTHDWRKTEVKHQTEAFSSEKYVISAHVFASTLDQTAWRFVPGTAYTTTLEIPAGAEVVSAGGGTLSGQTLTWSFTANAEGLLIGPGQSLDTYVKISFPFPAFSAGQQVNLIATSTYELVGLADPIVVSDIHPVAILAATVDMNDGALSHAYEGDSGGSVNIEQPLVSTSKSLVARVFANSGTLPIPSAVVTWHNDPGTNKAALTGFTLYAEGETTQTDFKVTYFVKNADGTEARTPTAVVTLAAGKTYKSISMTAAIADYAKGEYIEKIEFVPQDEGVDAMPVGCSFVLLSRYQSWPSKTFPDGTAINLGDKSDIQITVKWKGETSMTGQSARSQTADADGYYYKDSPVLPVYFGTNTATPAFKILSFSSNYNALTKDASVSFDLQVNPDYISPPKSSIVNPCVVLCPPAGMSFDAAQTITVLANGTAWPSYPVTITTFGPPERPMYRLTVPTLPNNLMKAVTFFGITYKVLPTAIAGSYAVNNAVYATAGMNGVLLGMTYPFTPYLQQPGTLTNVDDTLTDYDGSADSTVIKSVHSASKLQVLALTSLNVLAELKKDGEWVSAGSGNYATVPLGGVGEYRFTLTNDGTVPIRELRLYDILPHINDRNAKGASKTTNIPELRGSQWDASYQSVSFVVRDENKQPLSASAMASLFGTSALQFSDLKDPRYFFKDLFRNTTNAHDVFNGAPSANTMSYYFDLNPANNSAIALPPGYSIVISGAIKAPASATASDIGKEAYNSFAIAGAYKSGGTFTAFEPAKQTFKLVDNSSASVSGVVWEDADGNGLCDFGEPTIEGAKVTLIKSVGGVPSADPTDAQETTTSGAGLYSFANLPFGDYFIQVDADEALAAAPHAFTVKSDDLTDRAASHVDATGLSGKITVAPATAAYGANAGIRRQYTVTYDGNGSTGGTVPIDAALYFKGDDVTAAAQGNLARTDYTFDGWNTKADGSGTSYAAGVIFDMPGENITLYAVWVKKGTPPPDDHYGTVYIRFTDTAGTPITGVTIVRNNLSLPSSGTVSYTEAPMPAGYRLADGEPTSRPFSVTDSQPSQTIEFKIVKTGTDEPEKYMKRPSNVAVAPGEKVDYIFSGFTNTTGEELRNYAISDLPPEGLLFVSGRLPAFTNGEGVTYRIEYLTDDGASHTIASGLPADVAYTFGAPALAAGRRILQITFVFDAVPAGFGQGDTISLTFEVAPNPPTLELVNRSTLAYSIRNEEGEWTDVSINDPGVPLNPGTDILPIPTENLPDNAVPKTGDGAFNTALAAAILSLALICALLITKKRAAGK